MISVLLSMDILYNNISTKFLIVLARSMKALQCTEKNSIGIQAAIVTNVIEYYIIAYQYIQKVSNNCNSRCEASDIY